MFNIVSTEIKNIGNIFEVLDKYFEYVNKHKEILKKDINLLSKIIEILIKVKQQNKSSISLVNYQYMTDEKNWNLMKLEWIMMVIVYTLLLCGMKISLS